MAESDEITSRKRELRRRRILENAESRLKKIAGASDSSDNTLTNLADDAEKNYSDAEISATSVEDCVTSAKVSPLQQRGTSMCQGSILLNSNYSSGESFDQDTGDSSSPASVNGVFNRSSFDDSYIFPKKVSDAENRSFGRGRADSRRNSSCTQIMMERLHYSYFRLSVLRPWIIILAALLTRTCFAMGYLNSLVKSIFLPFLILELSFQVWAKLELQVVSRQSSPSVLMGVLMLSGIAPCVINRISNTLKLVQNLLQDLALYIFTFVVSHFVGENHVS